MNEETENLEIDEGTVPKRNGVDEALIKRSFGDYKVGDSLQNGVKIDRIEGYGPYYLIYWAEGRLYYRVESFPEHLKCALHEFDSLNARYDTELRGTYYKDFNNIMARCLAKALKSNYGEDPLEYFTPAKVFLEEKGPLTKIYGFGRNFIVFKDKQGSVQWECKNISDSIKEVIRVYDELGILSRATLPKIEQNEAREILARELTNALRSENKDNLDSIFSSSKSFLQKRAISYSRTRYLLASLLSGSLVLSSLFIWSYIFSIENTLSNYIAWGAIGGTLGSIVSVMHRLNKLELDLIAPYWHTIIQAISRVILGLCFGIIAVIAIKTNLALGVFKQELLGCVLASVIAGFSERLIPDILDNLATSKK